MPTRSESVTAAAGPDAREALLADDTLRGPAFCRAFSDHHDGWIAGLFDAAVEADPANGGGGLAVVAVGGYGRGELAPCSDLDVLLLHESKRDVGDLADRLWYPIWDRGLKLGHAVRTPREALELARTDLETATSLLSARHLAGDVELTGALREEALAQWRKRSSRWLPELAASVEARADRFGEVAFLLEPDIKDGRGGLRDVHTLRWAELADSEVAAGDRDAVDAAYDLLLAARVALHRRTGRPGDRLVLQEQDGVAEALGHGDADRLMGAVSSAARTIAWTTYEAWARINASLSGRRNRNAGRGRPIADGITMRNGEIHLAPEADPAADPVLVLRAAVAAATHDARIDRESFERLADETRTYASPWPAEARFLLADLLQAGRPAIRVLESLDRRNLLVRMLPEWAPTRSRPQRNAYHRFTVDRHLWEAAIEAGALVDRVDRPDLLVIGALLHDIGKGYPGDHTEVGVDLVGDIGRRMGFPPDDVAVLVDMVRHHLLLPDVATRRDLADEATITAVAEAVGDVTTLRLLGALTEADSLATGPAAWGPWKAGLVAELVDRSERHLEGTGHGAVAQAFPNDAQRELIAIGKRRVIGGDRTLTVVARDRPGVFSRVAGVVAINGLGVLQAAAHSEGDMALSVFTLEPRHGQEIRWSTVTEQVTRALSGHLAVEARVAERSRTYDREVATEANPAPAEVRFDNGASPEATVIEVHCPDRIGVLYRITRALAPLDLDIRSAKVQTLGHRIVDSFYVRDSHGEKISDGDHMAEIERALLHAIEGSG